MPSGDVAENGPVDVRVGIVGGGLAGICAAIFLREKLGLRNDQIIGIDRHPELGGNWYENAYVGLACDTPAMVYQYSFALNPSWSCPFPPQPELLAYIQSVAKKFDVEKLFKRNRKTTRAEWDAGESVWRVSFVDLVDEGKPATKASKVVEGSEGAFECHFLFNTTHGTNEPGLPLIPGAVEETFQGDWWHSMRWPKDGLDRCRGKRVALVGCAAAAIQLTPELAKLEGIELTVYHRTPNHVVERPNDPYPEDLRKKWRENPMELRLYRAQFEQDFAQQWFESGFVFDSKGYKSYMDSFQRNLAQVQDPKLREILTPEFPLWCRRVLFHNDFYKVLNQPNVHLVQERIVRIESDGIVSAKQDARETEIDPNAREVKRVYDVIIYATGWAAVGGKAPPFATVGVNGVTWNERQINLDKGGAGDLELQSYMGVMQDGFPNAFGVGGALGLPLYSVIEAIETHVNFAIEIIRHCIARNIKAIAPSHAAVERWCKRIDELAAGTPTGSKNNCSGYYAIPKADGTETRRIYFGGLPGQLAAIMKYPTYSDFEQEKAEEAQRWNVPVAPMPNKLDEAYLNMP